MEIQLWRKLVVSTTAILLLMVTKQGSAQLIDDRACINKLLPCLSYLNGTRNPPNSCCDPLKSVIKSDPQCLCKMITNKATKLAEKAGINVNEAQQLPGRCGQHVNPIACLTSGATPNSRNSVSNNAYACQTPSSSMTTTTVLLILMLGAFLYC